MLWYHITWFSPNLHYNIQGPTSIPLLVPLLSLMLTVLLPIPLVLLVPAPIAPILHLALPVVLLLRLHHDLFLFHNPSVNVWMSNVKHAAAMVISKLMDVKVLPHIFFFNNGLLLILRKQLNLPTNGKKSTAALTAKPLHILSNDSMPPLLMMIWILLCWNLRLVQSSSWIFPKPVT